MELENIILKMKLARFRRPKAIYSPSYEDCRPKINTAILWDMCHPKGKLCKGRIGQGKEIKNLNEVTCSQYRNEYRNFKLAWATMGNGLGTSEEDWKR
jgi:hypothetical protein